MCQGRLCSSLKHFYFLLFKSETDILPCLGRHGCFQPENVLFIAAGWSRVRSAHSHTFTHLGAVQYHRCHCVLLTDHLHQSLRSVCLRGRYVSEMRKEKIGPVQGEIKLSSCSECVCVHSLSSLTPPRRLTLPSLCAPASSLPLQQ